MNDRSKRTLDLPCVVFPVTVSLAPKRHVSQFEQLVLEAIAEEINTLDELAHRFDVGHRLMLDLVMDLWQRGHLLLDPDASTLHLSAHAKHQLASDPTELEGGERYSAREHLVMELVTGRILPTSWIDRLLVKPSRDVIRGQVESNKYFDQDPIVIEEALRDRLKQRLYDESRRERANGNAATDRDEPGAGALETDGGDEEDDPGPDRIRPGSDDPDAPLELIGFTREPIDPNDHRCGRRWLRLNAQVTRTKTGRLHINITGPGWLSDPVRAALSFAATRIVEEDPEDTRFADAPSEDGADSAMDDELRVHEHMEKLRALVDALPAFRLGDLDADTRAAAARAQISRARDAAHKLALLFARLDAGRNQRARGRATIKWWIGQDAIDAVIRSRMGQARKQVVMSSPFITWARWQEFDREPRSGEKRDNVIRRLLDRGVKVCVVWGPQDIDRDPTVQPLQQAVVTTFHDDLNEYPGFLCPVLPVQTNERFVLVDDRVAIITGGDLLGSRWAREGQRFAVELRGRPCLAVRELLHRIKRGSPDLRLESDFMGPIADHAPVRTGPGCPVFPELTDDADADLRQLESWRELWVQIVAKLESELADIDKLVDRSARDADDAEVADGQVASESPARAEVSVSLVHERAHRDLMRYALDNCRKWLIVCSRSAKHGGLEKDLLAAAAKRGVKIAIVVGEVYREARPILDELGASGAIKLIEGKRFGVQGGMLATESMMVVTSHELLALDTRAYELGSHYQRFDTGVVVHGAHAARQGARAVMAALAPEALAVLGEDEPDAGVASERPDPAVLDRARRHHQLVGALAATRAAPLVAQVDAVRRWLTEHRVRAPDAFAELDDLIARNRLGATTLRRCAVAAWLDHYREDPGGHRDEWIAWLAAELWHGAVSADGPPPAAVAVASAEEAAAPDGIHAAALLIAGLSDGARGRALPPLWIAWLAAATVELASPRPDQDSARAAWWDVQDRTVADELALSSVVCLAIAGLLADRIDPVLGDTCCQALDDNGAVAPPILARWSAALAAYWRRYRRPLPRAIQTADVAELRGAAQEAYRLARYRKPSFSLGENVHHRLFGTGGRLTEIQRWLEVDDAAAADRWLAEFAQDHEDAADLVERIRQAVVREVPGLDHHYFGGPQRKAYVARVNELLSACRTWREARRQLDDSDTQSGHAANELAAMLESGRTDLEALIDGWVNGNAADYPAPLGRLLLARLADLKRRRTRP